MRSKALTVGTCVATPGSTSYGTFEGVPLPSGGFEQLPVVIVSGKRDGPTLWLTANIHGDEVAGIPVLHRLLRDDLSGKLHGTLVVLPSLNPAGLRTRKRHPYYDDRDPNRTFQAWRTGDGPRELTVFERLTARLFDAMQGSADYYIDLHCASLLSIPFSIRDRVLYRLEADRPAAEDAVEQARRDGDGVRFWCGGGICGRAIRRQELHRSTTGAALQELRLPAFTVELGGHTIAADPNVSAAVVGIRNVMRWAGMLDDPAEAMPPLPMPPDGRTRRRDDGPYPSHAGILDYKAAPGDHIPAGGVVAEIHDLWGRPVGEGVVRTTADSWIIGLEDGILAYPGAAIAHVGLVDEGSLVEAWPP